MPGAQIAPGIDPNFWRMANRIHQNDNARDAKPMLWIFEGSSILWFIGGLGLSLVAFRLCYDRFGMSIGESGVIGAGPLALAIAYIVLLRAGKPKSYDTDVFLSLNFRFIALVQRQGWLRTAKHLYSKPAKRPAHPRDS